MERNPEREQRAAHLAAAPLTDASATAASATLQAPSPLFHLVVLGSIFIPLACIPYIPIRRHLLGLRRSIQTLSKNTLTLQHELNTTLLHARLRKEETINLAERVRILQSQLDTVTKQASEAESARRGAEKALTERLDAAAECTAKSDGARLRTEEALKRQIDSARSRADSDRLPPEVLADVSTTLADIASFMEEAEIQWLSQTIPRDRGIDRMRQFALRLHTIAKARPSQTP